MTSSPPPASRSSRWCPQDSQKSRASLTARSPCRASAGRPAPPAPPPRPRPPGTRRRDAASVRCSGVSVRNASRMPPSSYLRATRHQHALGMVAERGRERDLLLGRRARGGEIGRTEVLDQALRQQLDGCRAIRLARLDDLHQRRPAERVDAEEARAERRARLARRAPRTSASANANAPGTAHSPGSAARSNTNVSDGSSRMVRSSFMRAALRSPDRARTGSRARPPGHAGPAPSGRATAPADRPCRRATEWHPSRAVR